MGWKNPGTSAALDTRPAASAAGVRIYETPDPDRGLNVGVVEWNDGVAGDSPATAIQSHNPNPRGADTPFGALALFGGSYDNPNPVVGGKLSAPSLSLEVGGDPVSGIVGPQARLVGGPLRLGALGGSAVAGLGLAGVPAGRTPLVQFGSTVLTLNGSGVGRIAWTATFPGGIVAALPTVGDTASNLNAVQALGFDTTGISVRGTTPGGTLCVGVVRINWAAIGW